LNGKEIIRRLTNDFLMSRAEEDEPDDQEHRHHKREGESKKEGVWTLF